MPILERGMAAYDISIAVKLGEEKTVFLRGKICGKCKGMVRVILGYRGGIACILPLCAGRTEE